MLGIRPSSLLCIDCAGARRSLGPVAVCSWGGCPEQRYGAVGMPRELRHGQASPGTVSFPGLQHGCLAQAGSKLRSDWSNLNGRMQSVLLSCVRRGQKRRRCQRWRPASFMLLIVLTPLSPPGQELGSSSLAALDSHSLCPTVDALLHVAAAPVAPSMVWQARLMVCGLVFFQFAGRITSFAAMAAAVVR